MGFRRLGACFLVIGAIIIVSLGAMKKPAKRSNRSHGPRYATMKFADGSKMVSFDVLQLSNTLKNMMEDTIMDLPEESDFVISLEDDPIVTLALWNQFIEPALQRIHSNISLESFFAAFDQKPLSEAVSAYVLMCRLVDYLDIELLLDAAILHTARYLERKVKTIEEFTTNFDALNLLSSLPFGVQIKINKQFLALLCANRSYTRITHDEHAENFDNAEDISHVSVAFNTDGRVLVSGSYDQELRVWDMDGLSFTLRFTLPVTDWISSVAIDSSANKVAVGSVDRSVRVFDIRGATPIETVIFDGDDEEGYTDTFVAFDATGDRLIVGFNNGLIELCDLHTSRESDFDISINAASNDINNQLKSLDYNQSASKLVAGFSGGTIKIWDLDNARPRAPLVIPAATGTLVSAVYNPVNNIIAAGYWGGKIELRYLHNPLQVAATIDASDVRAKELTALAFNRIGNMLVASFNEGFMEVFNVSNPSNPLFNATIYLQDDSYDIHSIKSLTLNQRNDLLAIGFADGRISLFDIKSWELQSMHGLPLMQFLFLKCAVNYFYSTNHKFTIGAATPLYHWYLEGDAIFKNIAPYYVTVPGN